MLTKLTDDQLADLAKGITPGEWHACCSADGAYSHYVFAGEGMAAVAKMLSNDPEDKRYSHEPLEENVTLAERQFNARAMGSVPQLLAELIQSRRTLERYRGALEKIAKTPQTYTIPMSTQELVIIALEALKEN